MPLYLGNERVRIILGGVAYKLNIPTQRCVKLLTLDGTAVIDSKGRSIFVVDSTVPKNAAVSSDNLIIQDAAGITITYKEEA